LVLLHAAVRIHMLARASAPARATMAETYQPGQAGGSRKSLVSFHCFWQVSQFTVL
jgi:hypothetical protein